MSDEQQRLEAEIAQLTQMIASLANMPDAQAALQPQLASKQAALAKLTQPSSPQSNSAGRDLYLATQQTINNFFGGQPGEDGERLLKDYLHHLMGECQLLRLSRLTGKERSGSGQEVTPDVQLQQIYTSLIVDGNVGLGKRHRYTVSKAQQLLERYVRQDRSGDTCLAEHVRNILIWKSDSTQRLIFGWNEQRKRILHTDDGFAHLNPDTLVDVQLTRPLLATEAARSQRLLVLLGEPGSGKSTVLRYLALQLAEQLLDPALAADTQPRPVPLYVPLGMVASMLEHEHGDSDAALLRAMRSVLDGGDGDDALRQGLSRFLRPALRRGGVILLCDGLDELPAPQPRTQVAQALAKLAQEILAPMVLTSRVKPYTTPDAWQLPADEGWQVRTIQPLAFGQVRAFVTSWYNSLAQSRNETIPPRFTSTEATQRATALLCDLYEQARVRVLVESPLLLTMLAILHTNSSSGTIPRDRALLYEECVQLVLERWEPVRTPTLQRKGLLEELGDIPGLTLPMVRQMIHDLAYQAHLQPPGDDGRGIIDQDKLDGKLFRMFQRLDVKDINAKITIFLRVLRQEIGLLQERSDNAFVLPHLTFEEYLAACYLADSENMAGLALKQWHSPDRERWREIVLLMVGRLRQQGKLEDKALSYLDRLLATHTGYRDTRAVKPLAQQRSEALLAALSYRELDDGKAFSTSALDIESRIDSPLRRQICVLLDKADSAITTPDRISAAQVLGQLGDPRFPITGADWQHELARRNEHFGKPDGYFCAVPAGTYTIGGWEEGEALAALQLPAFWIARFPITVAQYHQFMQGAGYDMQRWWTKEGWQWKHQRRRTQPRFWQDSNYSTDNQPVIGVTWYEATAFCSWLSEQLQQSLPAGCTVRLPTEAEWEVAAAWDGVQRRPSPWGKVEPTPELAIYNALQLDAPAPVGCCPAGVAACGALDLVGNTWEWTCSAYGAYPKQAYNGRKYFTPGEYSLALRGGSYYQNSTFVRCGARSRNYPVILNGDLGFRVIVASALAR